MELTVSAVIPTFNRKHYIKRALDSVFAQSLPVSEVLVVDDGSTDNTAEMVQSLYGDRVRLIRKKNGGVSSARTRGIQEARGDWIAFLDSDDEWTPTRNAELTRAASLLPEDIAWLFGDMRVITDDSEEMTLFREHGLRICETPHIFEDSLAVQFPFQFGLLQGSLIRRRVLRELDCFSAGLRSDDDLLAGFLVAAKYRFAAIPSIVGNYYRTSDLNASSVVVNGNYGADYFRSRMLAFEAVIKSGRKRPWNRRYAAEVRWFAQALAKKGAVPRVLGLQQFRYGGLSAKGLGFMIAALLGRHSILAWSEVREFIRRSQRVRLSNEQPAAKPVSLGVHARE